MSRKSGGNGAVGSPSVVSVHWYRAVKWTSPTWRKVPSVSGAYKFGILCASVRGWRDKRDAVAHQYMLKSGSASHDVHSLSAIAPLATSTSMLLPPKSTWTWLLMAPGVKMGSMRWIDDVRHCARRHERHLYSGSGPTHLARHLVRRRRERGKLHGQQPCRQGGEHPQTRRNGVRRVVQRGSHALAATRRTRGKSDERATTRVPRRISERA
jgi:hypothetical protein